ncbi:MAG TPA: hypothetical protein VE570_05550 [Thermoleophilaceae bacterium]|jgi:hypothetical protein|nr:hypothetical protein [Thermoleophilaceae bacterium]
MKHEVVVAGAVVVGLAAAAGPALAETSVCSDAATCTQQSAQLNSATIDQTGAGTNTSAVQQTNQSVQQIGDRNRATNVVKEKLVFQDGALVSGTTRTKTMSQTDGGQPDITRTATVCSDQATCSQTSLQANVVTVDQTGAGTNVAGVQQSNQSIQQIGATNTATNVTKQKIVYRGATDSVAVAGTTGTAGGDPPTASAGGSTSGSAAVCSDAATCTQGSAQVNAADVSQTSDGTNVALVQQANQSIQQIGDSNKARDVLKQQVKVQP